MNYAIRKTSPHTARIAFETNAPLNTTRSPEIWRFFPSNWKRTSMRDGVVLGHAFQRSRRPACNVVAPVVVLVGMCAEIAIVTQQVQQ